MAFAMYNSKEFGDKYMTKECDDFVEKYCREKNKTVQELASDIDEFYIVLEMFDDFLKNKK